MRGKKSSLLANVVVLCEQIQVLQLRELLHHPWKTLQHPYSSLQITFTKRIPDEIEVDEVETV